MYPKRSKIYLKKLLYNSSLNKLYSRAEAVEFATKVVSHVGAILPNLLNEIRGDIVDKNKGPVDYVRLCHNIRG